MNNKGFSLIELMVVLTILGILAGISLPNIAGYMSKLEINEAAQTVAGTLKKARQVAVTQNIRTQVWTTDDGTAAGRIYVIYREQLSGETLTSTDTVTVDNRTLYAVESGTISPKGNIGMQTKATAMPDGGGVNVKTSLQINFTPSGTGKAVQTGDTTLYLMPDKEYAQNKRDKMRAITVSSTTGRVRIYTWNSGATSWQ